MLTQFISADYSSYEDFRDNFRIRIPGNFNFAYDVVDHLAAADPGRIAMVWCNDAGVERNFSFKEMSDLSSRAAHVFRNLGIRKGDKVMLILKRRYQFWYALLGPSGAPQARGGGHSRHPPSDEEGSGLPEQRRGCQTDPLRGRGAGGGRDRGLPG